MHVQCPVCHMQVPPDQSTLRYQGMQLAFCSGQCRERFLATPRLYIGVPGQKAAKQEGRKLLKRRCIRFDSPLTPAQMRMLEDAVTAMMGIEQLVVEENLVKISYDLLEATEEQIERTLRKTGARLSSGWTERLRRGWVHYTEECEAMNMQVTNRIHEH